MRFNWYNGATAASVLLVVLVVLTELVQPFKEAITAVFTHHWIAKAVLIAVAFVVVGFTYRKEPPAGMKSDVLAWGAVLGSALLIFMFYFFLYFT